MLSNQKINEIEKLIAQYSEIFVKKSFPSLLKNYFHKIKYKEMSIFLSCYFYFSHAGYIDARSFMYKFSKYFIPEDILYFMYRFRNYFDIFYNEGEILVPQYLLSKIKIENDKESIDYLIKFEAILVRALLLGKIEKKPASESSIKEEKLYDGLQNPALESKIYDFFKFNLPIFDQKIDYIIHTDEKYTSHEYRPS
jgi:hypothetical protein